MARGKGSGARVMSGPLRCYLAQVESFYLTTFTLTSHLYVFLVCCWQAVN